MACKPSSFLALLLIVTILLATTWEAVARRHVNSPKHSNKGDKKEPQFMFPPEGNFHFPGFGGAGLPPLFGFAPQNPNTGGSGLGGSGGPAGRGYVPGGDDTFVPNPGFEVPNPVGSGGGVPVPVNP